MGSFSFLRADRTTSRSNFVPGDAIKILIPKAFGGGYIRGHYGDYGLVDLDQSGNAVDVYDLVAVWNKGTDCIRSNSIVNEETYDDYLTLTHEEMVDKYGGDYLRKIGIDIGCYKSQINALRYPLKLVSISFKGTYEDCEGRSYNDPEQGFIKTYWN